MLYGALKSNIDQYWCIDGKYKIYVALHETGGKTR
jgi:hypothetical protein